MRTSQTTSQKTSRNVVNIDISALAKARTPNALWSGPSPAAMAAPPLQPADTEDHLSMSLAMALLREGCRRWITGGLRGTDDPRYYAWFEVPGPDGGEIVCAPGHSSLDAISRAYIMAWQKETELSASAPPSALPLRLPPPKGFWDTGEVRQQVNRA